MSEVFAPTANQVDLLTRLGCSVIPSTRSEASKVIDSMIAARETAPATKKQKGLAAVLGGRDLPGAGLREKSTQIYLLEALALLDTAQEQDKINEAAELLISRVREKFQKTVLTSMPMRKEESEEESHEAAPF